MNHRSVTILDGGMGRELERIGAPFRQPEWSALALLQGPERVAEAHRNFVNVGAKVITTNSYACVPFHIGEERFRAQGRELAALSGEIARRVASEFPGVRVAGSIPPVFGSYRPDLFDESNSGSISTVLIEALAPFVDHWLVETISSIAEARAALRTIVDCGDIIDGVKPRWVSFTLEDTLHEGRAVLRSGESVSESVGAIMDQVAAVLFNCSQPEVMDAALREAAAVRRNGLELGVYANAFAVARDDSAPEANEGLSQIRSDLTPDRYREFAQTWIDAGATIVGGCCGIGPEHIGALAELVPLAPDR
jgi:S-methylmethionine-dependent homocysteine/selenocysteine methylase